MEFSPQMSIKKKVTYGDFSKVRRAVEERDTRSLDRIWSEVDIDVNKVMVTLHLDIIHTNI